MKRVPTADVKKRSRELTTVFESFDPYAGMGGNVERVWVTDIASDGIHLVCSYSPATFLLHCLALTSVFVTTEFTVIFLFSYYEIVCGCYV